MPQAAVLLMADAALQKAGKPLVALRYLAQASSKNREARSLVHSSVEMLKSNSLQAHDKAWINESLAGSETGLSRLSDILQSDPAFRRRSAALKNLSLNFPREAAPPDDASDNTVIDMMLDKVIQEVQDETEEDGILTQLMDLCWNKQWLGDLSRNALHSLIACIGSFIQGAEEADRLTFTRASRGQPLSLLLSLYSFTLHDQGLSSEVLSFILTFVSRENVLVKAEVFQIEARGRRIVQKQTDLIKTLLDCIRESIPTITQPSTAPLLGENGKVKGYATSRSPLPASKEGEACQLEMWISVLIELSSSSKSICRELYRRGAVDFLDNCLDLTLTPPLLSAVEKGYGSIASNCELLAMDVCQSSNLALLCGVSLHSKSTTLALAALDRLSSLVDSTPTPSFLQIFKPGGVIHCSYSLLSLSINLKASASSSPKANAGQRLHPWTAAVMSLASPSDPPQAIDFNAQHSTTFRDVCRSLFLSAIERARRMEGKKPGSPSPGKLRVPCVGFLAFLRPRDVMMMERQVKNDENSALVPSIPCSSVPKPAAAEVKRLPSVRHPSPTSPLDASLSLLSEGSSNYKEETIEAWTQTESDVSIKLVLPRRAEKKDLTVDVTSERLCVNLGGSIVLQGQLRNKIESSLTIWTFDRDSSSLDLLIVKAVKGHYWRSLFLGGPEKSHIAVLQEAIMSDEPLDDSLEARELLATLREKQRQVVDGSHSLENTFDDFRLVLGDGML